MEEQELRGRLEKILCRDRGGTLEEHQVKMGEDVNDLLDLFEEADYVKLAKDQSLPELNWDSGASKNPLAYLTKAQQDMLKAGFRKVEKETKEGND